MKEELRAMRAELQEVSSYQRDFPRLPIHLLQGHLFQQVSTVLQVRMNQLIQMEDLLQTCWVVDLSREIATDPSALKTVVRRKP